MDLNCFRNFRNLVLLVALLLVHSSAGRPSADDDLSSLASSIAANFVDEECISAGCNRTVASLVKSINATADPCEDFFEFACGGFVRDTPLPDNIGSVSVVAQMEEKLRLQLKELLEEPCRPGEPASFHKAKILFQSCNNTTRLEELGFAPVRKILAEIGGWPVLEGASWNESGFDWLQMNYRFLDRGMYGDYLFTFDVDIDITNTTRHTIRIDMPDLNLDLKSLDDAAKSTRLTEYLQMVRAGALMLGDSSSLSSSSSSSSSPSSADLIGTLIRETRETLQIVMLEMQMNHHTKSLEDRHNVTGGLNMMTIAALQEVYPYVPWLEFARHMLPPGANITDEEVVMVSDPDYMAALGTILATTPKRVLANYLVWRALEEHVLPYLNDQARAVFVQKNADRMGQSGERWDECVKFVQHSMRMATSAMYVRRFSSEDARRKTREMVQDISKEMHRLLESVDWMDPKTRRSALLKAEMMRYNVAYPDELLNDTVLDEYFQKVNPRPDRLLENSLELDKEARSRSTSKFHAAVKKQDWTYIAGVADIVNAFFAHGDNSLSIPAGLLQGAFFQHDRPQYMNYGAIGFAIGHEVSHGFDETGGLFNMNGMMENWWDDETKKLFDDKVRCIVQLYGSLKSPEINATVNGVLTQSENIADNAALKLAYRAYRRHTARHGPEPRMPLRVPLGAQGGGSAGAGKTTRTLILKPRQLFWVSFASVWCSKETPKELNRNLRTSSHLPGIHRVNGAVRNQKDFAADFQCASGSPMNPEHKCQVW